MSQGIPPHRSAISIQIATASIFALCALAVPAESDFPIRRMSSSNVGSLHGRGSGIVFFRMLVSKSAIGQERRAQTAPFLVSFPAAIIAPKQSRRISLTHHSWSPSLKKRMEPSSPDDHLLIQWNTARSICCTRVVYFEGGDELARNLAIKEDLVSDHSLDAEALDAASAYGSFTMDARITSSRIFG